MVSFSVSIARIFELVSSQKWSFGELMMMIVVTSGKEGRRNLVSVVLK